VVSRGLLLLESINDHLQPELGDTRVSHKQVSSNRWSAEVLLHPPPSTPKRGVGWDDTIASATVGKLVTVRILPPLNAISLFLPCLAWCYSTSRLPSCKMLWEWRGLGTSQESLASHRRELLSLGQAFYKSKINACISIAIYSSPTHSCFTLNLSSMWNSDRRTWKSKVCYRSQPVQKAVNKGNKINNLFLKADCRSLSLLPFSNFYKNLLTGSTNPP